VNATPYLFLGPMICALARPIGGWCGDRIGGGITTLMCNLLMALATLGILYSLPGESDGGSFSLFLVSMQLIFFAAGVGNGSSYQLSPKVFLIEAGRQASSAAKAWPMPMPAGAPWRCRHEHQLGIGHAGRFFHSQGIWQCTGLVCQLCSGIFAVSGFLSGFDGGSMVAIRPPACQHALLSPKDQP
jgi:nitrate/nitrite transporter NarK